MIWRVADPASNADQGRLIASAATLAKGLAAQRWLLGQTTYGRVVAPGVSIVFAGHDIGGGGAEVRLDGIALAVDPPRPDANGKTPAPWVQPLGPASLRLTLVANSNHPDVYRAIKRLVRSMLEFKAIRCVRMFIATTRTMHLIHKDQPQSQFRLQPASVTSWLFKRRQAHRFAQPHRLIANEPKISVRKTRKRKLMRDRNQRWSSTSTQVHRAPVSPTEARGKVTA